MKRTKSLVACVVAFALFGGLTLKSVDAGRNEGKAVVRAVHGNCEYESNGAWLPLKPNHDLAPGVKIRTGADAYTDLFVNGTSTVRITADTVMIIPEMWRVGPVRGADTETTLDLQDGTILGNVKKLSSASHYEIKTPQGVAGIRGTDFQVTVQVLATGGYRITYTSVTGEVLVSATIPGLGGTPIVRDLHTGESWTPGVLGNGNPTPVEQTPQDVQNAAIGIINALPLPQIPPPTVNNSTGANPPGSQLGNPVTQPPVTTGNQASGS
jgi:hypothetical protein